jgi:hypothetical protein
MSTFLHRWLSAEGAVLFPNQENPVVLSHLFSLPEYEVLIERRNITQYYFTNF